MVVFLVFSVAVCHSSVFKFDPGKATFTVKYKEENSAFRINAVFLLPGESITLQIKDQVKDSFSLVLNEGLSEKTGPRSWAYTAPDSIGLYAVVIYRAMPEDSMLFNVFVMVPAAKVLDGYLSGYHIGTYPSAPIKDLEFYHTPLGFIKADPKTMLAMVSPHFQLGQFICKQPSGPTSYLVLKERLILKLEVILGQVNARGYPCPTFHILSGFRTPFYNHHIGNVSFSAHQFGGAADIFIDANPEDGEMDDLNKDGKVDDKDSEILFDWVNRMTLSELFLPYLGGLGKYIRNKSHGPFVHVDVRGVRALW